jgi:uncharacterized damage-inducible protein DinB
MTTKEILLEQFTAAYDENGWFVALKNAISNLNAEAAAWKTEKMDNSIWEILSHLNYYNYAYLERFKGVDYVYSINSNDETFTADISETAWQAEIEKFEAIMNEWSDLLESADENKFNESVSSKNKSAWGSVISHISLHNAHHGGQIVVLRKLQGNWDSSKGVS